MPAITTDEQLSAMTQAELDSFPHGIIRLDRLGTILYYNHSQAALGHLTPNGSIGLNFFRDVAPCTAVKAFQGRFTDFAALPGSRIDPFHFLLRFAWGQRRVSITMVRKAGNDESIYIVVTALGLDSDA